MSANLFESATQALPLYSHQYKSAWDASGVPYNCPIALRLEPSSSPLLTLAGGVLILTSDDLSQAGTHTATVTAFYDGITGAES